MRVNDFEVNEILLDIAKQRFDQEANHSESIDSKAGSLIGYSGVIATFISFLFSANIISTNINQPLLMVGVILSLLAIMTGFVILVPFRKTRDIFKVKEFVNDFQDKSTTEQINEALNTYLVLIEQAEKQNNRNSIILYVGNILLGIGILISFISIIY